MGMSKLEDEKSTHFKDATRRRPMLIEFQEKKYAFPNSNLSRRLDNILKKGIVELPKPKRPDKPGRSTDPKYILKKRIVELPKPKRLDKPGRSTDPKYYRYHIGSITLLINASDLRSCQGWENNIRFE